ncbi:hypothetical protein EYF80_018520 [Liparis tanakae]|uniref:Uncharacterized protein n=1 Tax=Liparis tanakae TaxID=230148 RepID=A0A4Z2I1R6_9TELE|nr:hypothetical protein EYF80_018520 [Liparis tanakae]
MEEEEVKKKRGKRRKRRVLLDQARSGSGSRSRSRESRSPCAKATSHQLMANSSQLLTKVVVKMTSVKRQRRSTSVVNTSCRKRPCSRMFLCARLHAPFLAMKRALFTRSRNTGLRGNREARPGRPNSSGMMLFRANISEKKEGKKEWNQTSFWGLQCVFTRGWNMSACTREEGGKWRGKEEEEEEEEEKEEEEEEEEVYMSALTKEANMPSSCSRSVSGLSYSRMFPLFITMTRSAVRMV